MVSKPLVAFPIVIEPSVPVAPKVGVAVHAEAVVLEVFGICPAAPALVAFVPPAAIVIVGRSPIAIARNAGAVAVANKACVVVLDAEIVEGAALAPPPIITPYCPSNAVADWLVVVSYHGI